MTLVARPIPPTPPQSTDGHPLSEEFGGPGVYQPTYDNMAMSDEEISTRQQEMVSLLFTGCCLIVMLTISALRFSSILQRSRLFSEHASSIGKFDFHVVI